MKEYIDRLKEEHTLTREGFETLLSRRDADTHAYALEQAVKIRQQIYGRKTTAITAGSGAAIRKPAATGSPRMRS